MTGNPETTNELTRVLQQTKPEQIGAYLQEHADKLIADEKPFAAYMKDLLRKKGLRQQDVFLRADIPEKYGYRLISEEKRTRRRDVLLRICLAAQCTFEETQHALRLYRMPLLYAKFPRDAICIIAFNTQMHDPNAVDELLIRHGQEPLYVCGALE